MSRNGAAFHSDDEDEVTMLCFPTCASTYRSSVYVSRMICGVRVRCDHLSLRVVSVSEQGLGEEDDDDCPSRAQRDCDSKGDEAERAEEERAAEVKQSSNTERIAHNTM